MRMREMPASTAELLGQAIRQSRRESGLTQREAAAYCNVSLPFLNEVEQGKPTARIGMVLEVCARFGIEIRAVLPAAPE